MVEKTDSLWCMSQILPPIRRQSEKKVVEALFFRAKLR